MSTRPADNACLFIPSIFFRLFLTVVLVCSCTCCYIFVSYITNCLCGPHDVNNIICIHRQELQLPNGASVTRTTVICRFWLLSNDVVSLNACNCVSTPRRKPKMFVAVLEGCVFSFSLKMFSVETSLQFHGAGDRKIHTAGPQNAKLHYKRSSLFASRSSTYVTRPLVFRPSKKGKGSPYSITELRVPELIPVLGSQPAGDVSHKPGGRLPLLSARPAVTPATLKRAATSFAAW